MSANYIYTEKNDCQDCYKCIRECPVKAIKMEDQSASIIQENCIYCGHCATVCPVEAKKVKNDLSVVKYLLANHEKVIVSLAPSWVAEFPEFSINELVYMFKKLGFFCVSETAIGAEIVTRQVKNSLANSRKGVFISSCCPSVVELIHKYYPNHADKILQIDTPMIAHGKFLKEYYGSEAKVIFTGPCIAKKKEADMSRGIIDSVITFKRLREWFQEENLFNALPKEKPDLRLEPFTVRNGSLYPIAGGMISNIGDNQGKHDESVVSMSFSGLDNVMPIIKDLDMLGNNRPVFLELLSCNEGCINGPGKSSHQSPAINKTRVLDYYNTLQTKPADISVKSSLHNPYDYINRVVSKNPDEREIVEVLKSIGKHNKSDELNCGGCGYESCRDFAKAILNDKAEQKMCVSYIRRVAQDKATALLHRMPYGVVIVDKNMRIVESNRIFAELAGEEAVLAYEVKPGLEGADLTKLIPFHDYFRNLFNSQETVLEKDIHTGNHFLHLSIFSLGGKNQQCAILHNLRAPELTREEIVKRSKKVIRENLETVQKIAFLLGENASSMETLLNSIVKIHTDTDAE